LVSMKQGITTSHLYKLAEQGIVKNKSQLLDLRELHKQIDVLLDSQFKLPVQYNTVYTPETEEYVRRYLEVRLEGRFEEESLFSLFVQNRHFGRVIWEKIMKSSNNILKRDLDIYVLFALFLWTYTNLAQSDDTGVITAELRPRKVTKLNEESDLSEEGEIEEIMSEEDEINLKTSYIDVRVEFLEEFKNYIWLRDEFTSGELEEGKNRLIIDLDAPGKIFIQKGDTNNRKKEEESNMIINTLTTMGELAQLHKEGKLMRHKDAEMRMMGSKINGQCHFCSSFCNKRKDKLYFCGLSCYNMYKGK